jgi:hypothetical protein
VVAHTAASEVAVRTAALEAVFARIVELEVAAHTAAVAFHNLASGAATSHTEPHSHQNFPAGCPKLPWHRDLLA